MTFRCCQKTSRASTPLRAWAIDVSRSRRNFSSSGRDARPEIRATAGVASLAEDGSGASFRQTHTSVLADVERRPRRAAPLRILTSCQWLQDVSGHKTLLSTLPSHRDAAREAAGFDFFCLTTSRLFLHPRVKMQFSRWTEIKIERVLWRRGYRGMRLDAMELIILTEWIWLMRGWLLGGFEISKILIDMHVCQDFFLSAKYR